MISLIKILLRSYLAPIYNKIKSVNINMSGFLTENQKMKMKYHFTSFARIEDNWDNTLVMFSDVKSPGDFTESSYIFLNDCNSVSNAFESLSGLEKLVSINLQYCGLYGKSLFHV